MSFASRTVSPLGVGLVGTGYAARLRAETFQSDARSRLIAVAGNTPEKTQAFCQTHEAEMLPSWVELIDHPEIDLVVIATINRDHGAIARAALEAGKHVVLEYPLALDVAEAESLVTLAKKQGKLLHVEHIELLGGLHQAFLQFLPQVGAVFYVRHSTINPQRPAPQKWTYRHDLFGFPLIGALSRIQRLTHVFGAVATVSCQARFWDKIGSGQLSPFYTACICTAQLRFCSGLLAEVIYGKGETVWQATRSLEVHGEKAALIFEGDQGSLVQPDTTIPIEVGSRRGLFAKDTAMVLDHLFDGQPLYVTPENSLYALKVADAARRSAELGQVIAIENG